VEAPAAEAREVGAAKVEAATGADEAGTTMAVTATTAAATPPSTPPGFSPSPQLGSAGAAGVNLRSTAALERIALVGQDP
jgi:hypothetical protein